MSDLASTSTANLFRQWRTQGDGAAGQAMAQRFSDWYYAVTTCRLGDAHGRAPLQRACVRFQQGILSVTTAAELTDWSHGVLMEEVRMAGGRIAGGDFPNQLTGGRSPTELLRKVAPALPADQAQLLSMAYDTDVAQDEVVARAEALGGYPFAVLAARLALKKALRDGEAVPFGEVPDAPNLDLGPLPLYEAGRMGKEAEEAGFEKWMLTDMRLCKDIAEFGVFAQALRAGALRGVQAAPKPAARPPEPSRPAAPAPAEEEDAPSPIAKAAVPVVIVAALGLTGLAMIAVALGWMLFR